MKPLFVYSVAFFIALLPLTAGAANMAGDPCTQIGETRINAEQTGIVGCFKTSSTDNALVWKSFVGANPYNSTQCYTVKYKSASNITFTTAHPASLPVNTVAKGKLYGSLGALQADYPLVEEPSDNAPWAAISCVAPYERTACALAVGGSDNDIRAIGNGCIIDNEEAGDVGSFGQGLFITCCT